MSTSSNAPVNDATSPAPIARPKRTRWGGIIFFKVEEIVFEAPQYRFAEHSEVFEAMFHLPSGSEGRVDGQDEEHPIVLEGYQATHFDALLKILYPTPHDFISGTLNLDKEGWIGVLNLSTRWSMKEIRKHAIDELSRVSLSPMEKIALGREHQVAKWFQDGLTELVSEDPIQPLAELRSLLGAEMACTLLWIQNQILRIPHEEGLALTGLTLGMLACWSCKAAMFTSSRNCISCSRIIAVDDCTSLYIPGGTLSMHAVVDIPATGPAKATFDVHLQHVICRGCSNRALSSMTYTCPSCSYSTHYNYIKLRSGKNAIENGSASQKILEEFGDEIARYESWDQ
ncbi:hypothetical protein EST38_g11868 [Candolleomyces aberdarensis]|uniref:BTB domain-containing protein n=1 Tax=Candolleomyces aberdarensis TaxID=2316362 RepID=A0A4Q2D636_9AGAR|nr:hypothetical protein EST38_g11868 [Candolleomyces aberdarensis]